MKREARCLYIGPVELRERGISWLRVVWVSREGDDDEEEKEGEESYL